jgi:FkbH-like protein
MLQQITVGEIEPARIVVWVEWSDLDPRLGLRSEMALSQLALNDIVHEARESAERIGSRLSQIGARAVLVPPTLSLPPFFPTRPEQASSWQCALRSIAAQLCVTMTEFGVSVVDVDALTVAPGERRSARNEVRFGFPFTERHAKDVAAIVATLISPPVRRKGLVLDLDGTLWKGIVGDDGAEAISWNLNQEAIGHALLQRASNLLGDCGVLLGVVSKNEPDTAEAGLARKDLIVSRESLWPVVAGWHQKSAGVLEIARAWNIGADAIVMLDDSALELAEVAAAIHGIQTLQFDGNDPEAILHILTRLRELFGSARTTEEDRLRSKSIRASSDVSKVDVSDTERYEAFLAGLHPELIVRRLAQSTRDRATELVNKTNQFNLTGSRVGPENENEFFGNGEVWLFEYADRLSRLGVIGLLRLEESEENLVVTHWVLSCRAFARRVEHAMMAFLGERAGERLVRLPFTPSAKNAPLSRFLEDVLGVVPSSAHLWSSQELLGRLPRNLPAASLREA